MKVALFLAHLKARNCSSKTINDYKSDLKIFAGFLKERHLRVTQVKSQTIDQFVEWLRSLHNYKTGTTGMADASIRGRGLYVRFSTSILRGERKCTLISVLFWVFWSPGF